LASTALAHAGAIGLTIAGTALPLDLAWADGGRGAASGGISGGAGAAGFSGGNGDNGSPAGLNGNGGGGGGGGAADTTAGGNGGIGGNGTDGGTGTGGHAGNGGTGAAADGVDGGAGNPGDTNNGGGGGGGGGGGTAGNGGTGTIAGSVTGGKGGNGGDGGDGKSGGGGGGGGAGGVGAEITTSVSNSFTVTGGNGGNGGSGGSPIGAFGGDGGNGGTGGAGILAATGISVTNSGMITGGNGGSAGAGAGLEAVAVVGAGGAGITGSGLTIINSGTISGGLAGDGVTLSNAITFTGGANAITFSNATSGLNGNVDVTGSLTFNQPTDTTVSNVITGSGSIAKTGAGTLTLSGTNTYSGGTAINGGTIAVTDDSNLGNTAGGITFNGGTLQTSTPVGVPTFVSNRTITLLAGGGTIETDRATILGGNISGAGGLTKTGIQILSLTGTNTYLGATNILAGQLQADAVGGLSASSAFTVAAGATLELRGLDQSIGSLAGAGSVTNFNVASSVLTTGNDNTSTTFSGTLADATGALSLIKVGTGTQTLSGINTYTGNTTVNGGRLEVDGSIATSQLTTVNASAMLAGTGTVGATQVNAGGIFAPGNGTPGTALTVTGSLTLASAAQYLVQINPTTSSLAIVTGTATLGGATVNAIYANGSFVEKRYTILSADRVSGTFNGPVSSNLPSGFKAALSYDPTHAFLDLSLAFIPPPGTGLNANQQNVGNAIINFFNSNGGIPLVFGGLTPAGLTQISGETAVGSQQTTFDAMSQFMGVMTDPFIAGRGDPVGAGGNPNAYADEESLAYAAGGSARTKNERDAYAAIYRKAPPMARFEQRWSVWAAGFGGSQTTDGNAAAVSNNTSSSIYGTAVGADYRFSPDTLAGFALAGGGTNFSVNGAGSGRSDLFQAGAFIRHNIGAAYLTGALAYGWQDVTTDRTVTAAGADHLRAEFNANAWSGRVEGGYRFVAPLVGGIGITPYAAGQFTTFDLPAYAESVVSGSGAFALAYGAKSVTDSRSEFGLRTDKAFAMADGIVTLRGRLAWAHDFNPDRTVAATFQALPGASFVVNGAAQAADSALVTAAVEKKWLNGWSAAATFEGEFSDVMRSYTGKGVVRYQW
jgi:autotransporter-associated beta strand protein